MERLSASFPAGVAYRIDYDPTMYVRESIRAVVHTLFEAIALVVVVVMVMSHLLGFGEQRVDAVLVVHLPPEHPAAPGIELRGGNQGALTGRVLSAAYLGDHMEYEVETPLGRLFAIDAESERALPQGSVVSLEFRPRGLALID